MQVKSNKIAVFVGPTLYGCEKQLQTINLTRFNFFPPVQRNDLTKLEEEYNTVVIVDGFFHAVPAVGHIELRKLIDKGTNVIGCSSMGAIRAYEMKKLGMSGYGKVYEMFFQYNDFTDDEVTQLHDVKAPYKPYSEPLVNIRYLFNKFISEGRLKSAQSIKIINELKKLYYGYRTIQKILQISKKYTSIFNSESELENYCNNYRIKSIDLLNLLKELSNDARI